MLSTYKEKGCVYIQRVCGGWDMCINIYVYVCVPLWRFYILRRVFIYICLYACILAPRIEIKKEEKKYAKEAADSVYVCIHSKQLYFAACEYMHICTLCACASFVYASLFYIAFFRPECGRTTR